MANQITPNPSVPSQVVADGLKFPNFVNNLGIIPTSYKDSMSYYETLAWLCKYLEETVIPTVNQNGEAVEELQALYIELNSYVTHYFETLDVQEEINNKLDDMVEQGTLQEIIADYLNSRAVFGYDTVADMKASTNLINGSYARTLGYYEKNDGGSALYKIRTITNDDYVDNMFIIEMDDEENQLIAELIIDDELNLAQLGIKSSNNTDLQNKINYIISKADSKYLTFDSLQIDSTLVIPFNTKLKLNKLIYTGTNYAIQIESGRYGNISIDEIISESGNGVLIDPTVSWSGQSELYFGLINSSGIAVNVSNHQTIIETHFKGINWISSTSFGLNISPLSNSSFGHIKFDVLRVTNESGYALNINGTQGKITNIDFGYMSLENSKNGIDLTLSSESLPCEALRGYFRVYEVDILSATGQGTVLKASGKYLNITDECSFEFDRFHYNHIDVTELTGGYWTSKNTPYLRLKGACINGSNMLIGNNGEIRNGRLVLDYNLARPAVGINATTGQLDFETGSIAPTMYLNASSLSEHTTINLPKSLKPGVIMYLKGNGTYNVTLRAYGQDSGGETHSGSGFFTTAIDDNDKCYVMWLS